MCYLYFFCLHCCLINIHIFDYPDSRLSGLFTEVPTSPDNRGSTVTCCIFVSFCIFFLKDSFEDYRVNLLCKQFPIMIVTSCTQIILSHSYLRLCLLASFCCLPFASTEGRFTFYRCDFNLGGNFVAFSYGP